MAARHGTRQRYKEGCRCPECGAANTDYHRDLRERKMHGDVGSASAEHGTGAVEAAVHAEVADLAQATARPALVQAALALARVLDNPRATSAQPSAAAKLKDILDTLHKGADVKKSRLASVRALTDKKAV